MSHEAAALILLLIYHLLKRTDNSCHSLPIETQQDYPLQRTKRPQQYSSREAAGRLHLRLVVLPPLVGLLGDLVTPDANSFNTEIPRNYLRRGICLLHLCLSLPCAGLFPSKKHTQNSDSV